MLPFIPAAEPRGIREGGGIKRKNRETPKSPAAGLSRTVRSALHALRKELGKLFLERPRHFQAAIKGLTISTAYTRRRRNAVTLRCRTHALALPKDLYAGLEPRDQLRMRPQLNERVVLHRHQLLRHNIQLFRHLVNEHAVGVVRMKPEPQLQNHLFG